MMTHPRPTAHFPDLDLPKPKKSLDVFPRGHFLFDDRSALYYHRLDRYRTQTRHNKRHRKVLRQRRSKNQRSQDGQEEHKQPPDRSLSANANINSQAYENVRTLWKELGIWDARWTVLPGLQWPHEEPLEDYVKRHLVEEGFAEEVANEEAATEDQKDEKDEEEESSVGSDDDEEEEQKQEAPGAVPGSGNETLWPGFGLFGPSNRNLNHAPLPPRPGLFDPSPLFGPAPLFCSAPVFSPHLSSQDDDNDDDKDDGGQKEGAARTNGTVDTEAGDAGAIAAGPPPTSQIRGGNKTRPSRKRLTLAQEAGEDENEQQGEGEGEEGDGDAFRPAAKRSKRRRIS